MDIKAELYAIFRLGESYGTYCLQRAQPQADATYREYLAKIKEISEYTETIRHELAVTTQHLEAYRKTTKGPPE